MDQQIRLMSIKNYKIFLFFCLVSFSLFGQIGRQSRLPNYFGFQVRTIFPTRFIGESSSTISKDGFSTTISQKMGYSFGGTVRVGLTELIALETGINLTQRYYGLKMSLADSNLTADDQFGFIQYDIPINALIYIKFTDKFYMNASFGVAMGYKPSSIGIITNPGGTHQFLNIGLVDIHKKIGLDINANLGFEYRTKKAGIFYVGGSARLPLSPLFQLITKYKNGTYGLVNYGNVNGSYLSLDFKYFLPNHIVQGRFAPHGPIE